MEEYVPGLVYSNLIKLCEYRNTIISSEKLEPAVVTQQLNHYEHVKITAVRLADDPRGRALCVTILIAPGSKYATKTADFGKLLRMMPIDDNLEILIVSEEHLTSHIMKFLGTYREQNPKTFVEHYDYTCFLIESPKHESVPPHFIATAAEISDYCARHFCRPDQFPRILQSDPQAIWIGLRPGMCAKILRLSETVGVAPVFRICIK